MPTYHQEGRTIDFTPATATAAGTVVQIGTEYVGLINNDIAANELGGARVEGGMKITTDAGLASIARTAGGLIHIDITTQTAVVTGGDFDLPLAADKPAGQDWVIVSLQKGL